jgi:hypothetical protein
MSNNPGAADGWEILVVMQRLLAAADQERCTASGTDPDPTQPRFIAPGDPPQTSDGWPKP